MLFSKQPKKAFWSNLTAEQHLLDLLSDKSGRIIYLFKHSTRCSISAMALERMKQMQLPAQDFYYLDLIALRDLSNVIEHKLKVVHQSPQLIILKNGQVLGHLSHNAIGFQNIEELLSKSS